MDEEKKKTNVEEEKKKVKATKKSRSSKFIIIILLLIIVIVALTVGLVFVFMQNNEKISDLEVDNSKYKSEVAEKNEKIEELEGKVKELSQEDKITELENKKKNLESKIGSLESDKSKLEGEIESLKADVIKVKGEPKTYPAGQLVAGTDVPTGKYKISGGNSNFIVHSSSGTLKVNTILGGGDWGVEEYIYKFEYGDKIDAHSSFTLQEVE